ncbi:hypothetical protein NW768_010030 [Fusarium equiseti]|uniref:Major facilitator superfamily (MFS) profile domain-containing protein n=1 Tax=Fusarium equiseti TaxID=61235 RepID=A0ABQ8R208_FUSEQ|nr:hypothetical protein NW768_010030 [Fusarium equiseti]
MSDEKVAAVAPVASQDADPSKTHPDVIDHARAAADKEQKMTLMQGIKLYPKAVGWSILISTCIVMEGFDIVLVNNFYAFPQWNKKYGTLQPDGTYQVSAAWQAGLSNGANVGSIIGLFLNGWLSERFGYRYTIIGCLIWLSACITLFFTAQNVQMLLAAEILCGLPWGIFQTICVTYASEVCPIALRGYLTTYVNFCWGLGQEIGIGILRSMIHRTDQWAYRIPYGLQWIWPLPLIVGLWLAPESPWWLVRKGRVADAKKSLLRLTSLNRETDFDADETVAMMVHTTALEEKLTSGSSYIDCFKGVNRRRTEIVCMVWAMQNLSGNSFSNYSTYFLEQAGLSAEHAYSFALGQYAINMIGVFGAWGLMSQGIGRRTLYLYGLCGLCTVLCILGFLGLVPEADREKGALATGSLMIGWAVVYQLTVGSVAGIVGIINAVLAPYMLNPTAWNWSNFTGFFWGGICFLCVIYTYFRLPEPNGRTFAELGVLFEKGVSARKFATTKVDVFHESVDEHVLDELNKADHATVETVEKAPSGK